MWTCWPRVKRKVLFMTTIMFASASFLLYTLALSCCSMVVDSRTVYRGSVILVNPEDEAMIQEAVHHRQARHARHRIDMDQHHKPQRRIQNTGDLLYREQPDITNYNSDVDDINAYADTDDYAEDSSPRRGSNSKNNNSGGSRSLPQALIIGVKKGGTRALLEFLRIHPDIRAPGPEPHFFDRNYEKGLKWYRSQMPSTIEGQMTIEKTPSYFVTKGVPERVYNMSQNMKLILVVRDPVTRAISDYAQAASKRPDVKPFEEMAFIDNSTGLVDTSWGAIRIGVYAKHLERWLNYFPLSQIHFVNGETLITNPAEEMAKVQDFLGLKRVISEKHFYFNSTKGFPCLKKPERSGNPHCLGKSKGRTHPHVEEKVIKRLKDFFRPFNAKFFQLSKQDFGWS